MEIYAPFVPSNSQSAVVVILPGGGYGSLSPYERLFAEYFRGLGYTAVVVNYRVAPNRHPAPFSDAVRAIRLLRKNAKEWGVPAERLVLMGGSAGGHLAALVATRPDLHVDPSDDLAATVSARPDRLILAYPVISAVPPAPWGADTQSFKRLLPEDAPDALRREVSADLHVTRSNPPVFLFHAADDPVASVENSIAFARACWSAGVPAELHVFPRGGHGRAFAYAANTSARWRALVQEWLSDWPQGER